MSDDFQTRLEAVRERIRAACARSRRDPAEVEIVAVTKTFGPDAIREAADGGLTLMGESRVREAMEKIPLCPGTLEWHMIGHLQGNKVRDSVGLFRAIHSVDSGKLLEAINRASEAQGVTMPVCLEINVSGEGSKFGLKPAEVPDVLRAAGAFINVEIAGFMTVPPFTPDPEGARPFFRKLRELRDGWQEECGARLPALSMGMSHDFEVAVEEGATWVRLGSVLFGERGK
jgi:PLP dependent protein